VGNLTGKTDRKNQTITYTYDQLNRLTGKTYPDNSTVNYSYSNVACGTLQCYTMTATDSISGTITRTDDVLDRLASETTPQGTVSYSYDAAGRRSSLTVPGQAIANYTFDNANRLTQITQGSTTVSFSYDNANRRTTLTLPNGITTSYSYDNASQLTGLTYAKGSNTLGNLTYGYDLNGRRTNIAGSFAATNLPNAVSTTAYNANNQLTTWGTANLFYDYNGNTLTKVVGSNTTTYGWDFENRLTSVTLPGSGGTVSFRYDPFGRRIYKSSSSGTSIYAYDGDNLVEETNSSGAAVARYEDTQNIDEPLAMLRSAATSYYHADGLGSVTSLSSAAGSIANTYTYDSFGKLTASTGSLVNPFQYTARESDAETGLYYYRARYYDSNVGRFLNEDPPSFLSGGINFYEYVENSPLGFKDPNGLQAQPASTCCDPQKTKDILQQLQNAFSGPAAAKSTVFQKYKPCLQKMLGDITFQCGPPPPSQPTECGHTVVPGTVYLTPNGIAGKGGCKAAKSTVAHEMVHSCYNDIGPVLSGIDQEKEAYGIECQLFGLFCQCARNPKLCQ